MAKKKKEEIVDITPQIPVSVQNTSLCVFTKHVIEDDGTSNIQRTFYLPMRNIKTMFDSRFNTSRVIEYTDGHLERIDTANFDESNLSGKFLDSFMRVEPTKILFDSIDINLTKENIEELLRSFEGNMTIDDYTEKRHMQYQICFNDSEEYYDGLKISVSNLKESVRYGNLCLNNIIDLSDLIDDDDGIIITNESYNPVIIKYRDDETFIGSTKYFKTFKNITRQINDEGLDVKNIKNIRVGLCNIFIPNESVPKCKNIIKELLSDYSSKNVSVCKAVRRPSLSISIHF